MPPDPLRAHATRGWLKKTALDLRSAELSLSATPPILEDALFHCQQAAEKALKAFLTWHDRPFPKVHDLRKLAQPCVEIDPTLQPALLQAPLLTGYAWVFRYPETPVDPTREETQRALQLARAVVDSVLERLPSQLRKEAI